MQGVAMSAADLVESGAISGKMLKDLYDLSFERGKDFGAVYEEEGRPVRSSDTSALRRRSSDEINLRRIPSRWSSTGRAREDDDRVFRGTGDERLRRAGEPAGGE